MALVPASSRGAPAFNGGTITNPLVIDLHAGSGNDVPLTIKASGALQNVDFLDIIDTDGPVNALQVTPGHTFVVRSTGNKTVTLNTGNVASDPTTGTFSGSDVFMTGNVGLFQRIAAGALPTTTFVSGTAKQIDANSDRELLVPFTGDATNNAATLKIELSPDNLTFSILDTLSIAAALNLTGAINTPVIIVVPAGWYVKLTATHGTIGTSTYY